MTLYGPTPGSAASKANLKNNRSVLLVGNDLKRAAKDAKRSEEITNKDSYT